MTLAKLAADRCIEAGHSLEPRGFDAWRRACAELLRAGVARAAAREPSFAESRIELRDGISVAAHGRHHAQIVPDLPVYARFATAWAEAMDNCRDEHTRCELLRAPGFVAHFMSPPQDAFGIEVKKAVQSCMTLPPPY